MTTEYGLFNDESANWTAEESVEAGFYTREAAEEALRTRYTEDDELIIHECEPEEEEDEEDDSDEDEDEEDEDSEEDE